MLFKRNIKLQKIFCRMLVSQTNKNFKKAFKYIDSPFFLEDNA